MTARARPAALPGRPRTGEDGLVGAAQRGGPGSGGDGPFGEPAGGEPEPRRDFYGAAEIAGDALSGPLRRAIAEGAGAVMGRFRGPVAAEAVAEMGCAARMASARDAIADADADGALRRPLAPGLED